jgi:hypothetical protein
LPGVGDDGGEGTGPEGATLELSGYKTWLSSVAYFADDIFREEVRILAVRKPNEFVKIFVIFRVFFFWLYRHTTRHARPSSFSCVKLYPKYRFEISRAVKISLMCNNST